MALRNQPYMPLYVQDYLTNPRLNMCSAASQGIFVKIMCVMHKSDEYGTILLKQKDKQNGSTCLNFAYKLSRLLPFNKDELDISIKELVEENVLEIHGDKLIQPRMVHDNNISEIRAKAGTKGGTETQKKKDTFAQAKIKQNTKDEYVYENINEYINEIYKWWNEKKIITHHKLTDKIKTKINTTLKDYSIEQIKTSISNYAQIVIGKEYYFDYKWTLIEFLQRGLDKFLDLEIAKSNYQSKAIDTKERKHDVSNEEYKNE